MYLEGIYDELKNTGYATVPMNSVCAIWIKHHRTTAYKGTKH